MPRTTRIVVAIVGLGIVLALAACTRSGSNTGTSGGTGNTITLQNIAFMPASLTVKAGDTVTVKNQDQVLHHIVIGATDLGEQAPGATKTWKAPKDGVYVMKCLVHPSMQGQITVGAGGSTVGTPPAGGGTGGGGGGYSY